MYNLKRILIALDLTEMDDALIKYVVRLSNIIDIKKVYFIHVEKHLELPDGIDLKTSNSSSPLDETIEHGYGLIPSKRETKEINVKSIYSLAESINQIRGTRHRYKNLDKVLIEVQKWPSNNKKNPKVTIKRGLNTIELEEFIKTLAEKTKNLLEE